ncbi:MAG: deoxyribodipyrimidine photo-lyase [Bacteroidia bacterium]
MQPTTIFWFRRDLRLEDNAGLYHALQSGLPVQCIFIFDTEILDKLEDRDDKRLVFIHRALEKINEQLMESGSTLKTYYGKPEEVWEKVIEDFDVKHVFANNDYEPYSRERDEMIAGFFQSKNISFATYKDQVIFEKSEVVKDDGLPYTVFTPYKNKYRSLFKRAYFKPYPTEKIFNSFLKTKPDKIRSLTEMNFIDSDIQFSSIEIEDDLIKHYAEKRDIPSVNGTSRISVHLRFGTVSIRKLFAHAINLSDHWINELIWREFYMMILWHFPHVATSAFKPQYEKVKWRNNESEFENWCNGQTGYPIVDAGMRELNATGFMHNRVRMIVASFLTKHLLIDWRWGEAYFAKKLLDFELSSNNGGWQWAAGSGCDAAPYFRIFNPAEQTKKFDPQYLYIKKWVPEFQDLSYPAPIVEHKFARDRCLKAYSDALKG